MVGQKTGGITRATVLAFFFSIFALTGRAQTQTVVSGTITDPNGLPYAGGTIDATLVPTGVTPTVAGIGQISGYQQPVSIDVNGNFTMPLFCNTAGGGCTAISPSGTQWTFTIRNIGAPPPVGFGGVSFTATITITGATQDIGATLRAAAPKLLAVAPGGVAGPPCGSNTQIQYNNAGACGASANLTFTPGTNSAFTAKATGTGQSRLSAGPTGNNVIAATQTQVNITAGDALSTLSLNAAGASSLNSNIQVNLAQTTGIVNIGAVGTAGAQVLYAGSGSGIVTTQALGAITSYNFNFPTTSGSSTQLLTSGGGGSSPMTWTSPTALGLSQLLNVNTTPVIANAATTSPQNLMTFSIPAGTLNTLGKTIRITAYGSDATAASGTTSQITFLVNGSPVTTGSTVATTDTLTHYWRLTLFLTTTTTGSSGVMLCQQEHARPLVQNGAASVFEPQISNVNAVNLTNPVTVSFQATFNASSTSNVNDQLAMLVEQLN